jgi:hypothetical protein
LFLTRFWSNVVTLVPTYDTQLPASDKVIFQRSK